MVIALTSHMTFSNQFQPEPVYQYDIHEDGALSNPLFHTPPKLWLIARQWLRLNYGSLGLGFRLASKAIKPWLWK